MPEQVDALDVANYFIELSMAEKMPMSHMKLQKLLYYAQGYYLANKDQPLFDCGIQKWEFGPVAPIVYRKFKKSGLAYDVERHPSGDSSRLSTPIKSFLDKIWQVYGKYTGGQLSTMSHRESPWLEAEMYKTIDQDKIKAYFQNILREQRAKTTA